MPAETAHRAEAMESPVTEDGRPAELGEPAVKQLELPLRSEAEVARELAHQAIDGLSDAAITCLVKPPPSPPASSAVFFDPGPPPCDRQLPPEDLPMQLRLARSA